MPRNYGLTDEYIYVIHAENTNQYKIGKSTNPDKRCVELQTGNGNILKIIYTHKIPSTDTFKCSSLEKMLHKTFGSNATPANNEWFNFEYKNINDVINLIDLTVRKLSVDLDNKKQINTCLKCGLSVYNPNHLKRHHCWLVQALHKEHMEKYF